MEGLPKVLICPQHWGLGHVTRTIPVVRYFLKKGYSVVLASSGAGNDLLRLEFPELKLYTLPDYGITYPFKNMYLNMGLHLFQMHIAIIREFFAVRKICRQEKIGLIISDARLGAAQAGIPSAIITHHFHFSLHNRFFEWVSDVWMKFFYLRFRQIWIPDIAGDKNLSGDLSHLFKSSKHYFIGILSRFKPMDLPVKYQYAFILSGPEPQRTYFENAILQQLPDILPARCVLVRGTRSAEDPFHKFPNLKDKIEIRDFLSGEALNILMCSSEQIICRSGYSSLLDLCTIGKSAFLIPTPGQPEQEYLAVELQRKKLFHTNTQDAIQLKEDLHKAKDYHGYFGIDLGKPLDVILDERLLALIK